MTSWSGPLPERLGALPLELIGFAVVSGSAFLFDTCIFWLLIYWLLLEGPISVPIAATGSYMCGIVFHYTASSRLVFARRRDRTGLISEAPVFARFFAVALAGLAITVVVIGLLTAEGGTHPLLAKLIAAPLSFLTTFIASRAFVFIADAGPMHQDP